MNDVEFVSADQYEEAWLLLRSLEIQVVPLEGAEGEDILNLMIDKLSGLRKQTNKEPS